MAMTKSEKKWYHGAAALDSVRSGGLVCAIVPTLLYLNTLDCGLCFDDHEAIGNNQDLRPDSPWSNLLWNDFWGTPMSSDASHGSYRPLCVATFRLNYLLHELQPMGYHLVNVLLHSAVCFLYVQLCGVVFGEAWPALIAGLLFAVHPIHTEAVTGMVGRAELLSSLFFLLCLLCYHRAIQHSSTAKGQLWFISAMLLSLCSVLSKEQGITVIAVCLVFDLIIVQKMGPAAISKHLYAVAQRKEAAFYHLRPLLMRGAVLVVFIISVMVVRVKILMKGIPTFYVEDNPIVTLETPFRQLQLLYLCFVNTWLVLNPSFLCADWTSGTLSMIDSIADPQNIATLTTFIAILILALRCLSGNERVYRVLGFSFSLAILPYIPASSAFFYVGFVVAERVLYLPSMGFCMLVALGIWTMLKCCTPRMTQAVKFGLVYLLLLHSTKTALRNRDWHSDTTLWMSGVIQNPRNGKMIANLARQYELAGNISFAEELYRMGTRVRPFNLLSHYNLATLLTTLEKYDEAEEVYRASIDAARKIKTVPKKMKLYQNLGYIISLHPARWNESLAWFQKAIKINPDADTYMNIASLLLNLNRTSEAISSLEKILEYDIGPSYAAQTLHKIAYAYLKQEKESLAMQYCRRALSADENHVPAIVTLANNLQKRGGESNLKEARQLLLRAVNTEPDNARVIKMLGDVCNEIQDTKPAEEAYSRALSADPTSETALYGIGYLYYSGGMYSVAMEFLSRLIQLHPDHSNGRNLLGSCHFKMGNHRQTIEVYQPLVSSDEHTDHFSDIDYADVHSNVGEAFMKLGDPVSAEKHYRSALSINSSHAWTQFRLAYLYVQTNNLQKYPEAEQLLLTVWKIEPENGNITLCLGHVYYGLKNLSRAEEMLQQTLVIAPDHYGALYNLGAVRTEAGKYAEAVKAFERLTELVPHHVKAWTKLGSCYWKMNENAQAKTAFEAVLEKDPSNKEALNNLGLVLINTQQYSKAIDVFTNLLSLDPQNETIRKQIKILEEKIRRRP